MTSESESAQLVVSHCPFPMKQIIWRVDVKSLLLLSDAYCIWVSLMYYLVRVLSVTQFSVLYEMNNEWMDECKPDI